MDLNFFQALQSALLKNEIKIFSKKMQVTKKLLDSWHKTLKKEKKNEKKLSNSSLLLLFYIGKFIFCQKTYLEKLGLYCYIYFTVFCFFFHVAGHWKSSNTNAHIDIHCFYRRHTSIQNTWLYTRYFDADFDNNGLFLLFVYFRYKPSI